MGLNIGSNAISDLKLDSTQVDKVYLESSVVWEKSSPVPEIKALKFTSADTQILSVNNGTLGTITPNFEYSIDNGSTWTSWDVTTTITFGSGVDLYVRGSNTILAKTGSNYVHFQFSTASPVYCSGNVMHLYDYTQDLTSFPTASGSRGLKYLFASCNRLVTCPSLPATTLINSAYNYMFSNCTSLISLPALPAIEGASACYANMFNGCTSIKLSETQTGEYQNEYTIPAYTFGTNMFTNTGGTFTGTPTQATYYTSNTIIS